MSRFAALLLTIVICLPHQTKAEAGARVALVIGNSAYQEGDTLANPVNDARDMAAKLRSLGFTVIEGHDLEKRQLERMIGAFADVLDQASVGLFYYAGHGIGAGGRNFMVPVDAKLDLLIKLQLEAVPLDEVLDIMQTQAETSLVFLDACSNNPFLKTGRSAKSLANLVPVEVSGNAFVAYATQDGATASDGAGRNSPFAEALLAHMDEMDLSIYELMQKVRRDVHATTGRSQIPYVKDSLLEPFSFRPSGASPQQEVAPPSAEVQTALLERSLGDESSVETFLRRDYLAPPPGAIDQMVRRLYASTASIYGTQLPLDAIASAKVEWFAQWKSWTIVLEPRSLKVVPGAGGHADAIFTIAYDYTPLSLPAGHAVGRAQVSLSLVREEDSWRIVSESSKPL